MDNMSAMQMSCKKYSPNRHPFTGLVHYLDSHCNTTQVWVRKHDLAGMLSAFVKSFAKNVFLVFDRLLHDLAI